MARRLALYAAMFALVVALTPLAFGVRAQEAGQMSAGQKLAYLTKPAVVRIYDGYIARWVAFNEQFDTQLVGSGSGSLINPDGYILTNAHVTDLSHQGEEKGRQLLFEQLIRQIAVKLNANPDQAVANPNVQRQVADNSRLVDFKRINFVVLPSGDTFPFEIKEFGAPIGQGKDVSIIKIEVKNAPTLKIGDSDKLQLQDHVVVVGYPAAADTFDSGILDRKSALQASITDGKLSAKKNTSEGAPILQISAPATHGNSGGPVLNDAGDVIGMLTFRGDTVNGQEVSGFAFVVPTSTANEFIKKAGTTNAQSATDLRYQEGLELYLDGYYSKAIPKFEEVKRLFPQHSEIDQLLTDSQQKIAEGKDRRNWLPWIIVAAIVVVFVIIVIAVVTILLMRRGKKKAPAGLAPSYAGGPGFAPAQPQMSFPPQAPQQPSFPPMAPPQPQLSPMMGGSDKTVAIAAVANPGAQPGFGAITCTSGPLAGQRFDIRPEGVYIGRDGTLSQVVINDNRVSKRHVWIGPRNGRIAVVDQGSTNGTFLNVPGSQRVTEAYLNPGDTIIVSEADVARFQYQR